MRKPAPSTNHGLFSAKTWHQTLAWAVPVKAPPPDPEATRPSPNLKIAHRCRSRPKDEAPVYRPIRPIEIPSPARAQPPPSPFSSNSLSPASEIAPRSRSRRETSGIVYKSVAIVDTASPTLTKVKEATAPHARSKPFRPFASRIYAYLLRKIRKKQIRELKPVTKSFTQARTPKSEFIRLSPSRMIAYRLRSKHASQKARYQSSIVTGAVSQSTRLPILLLQNWLARQDLSSEPELSEAIRRRSPPELKDTMRPGALKGWVEDDLNEWIAILSAADGDARVQRFVSTARPKPLFMLFLLLRRDETIRNAGSLVSLLRYAKTYHMQIGESNGLGDVHVPNPGIIMTAAQFRLFLRRIVFLATRVMPQLLIDIARLAEEYITAIPLDIHHGHRTRGYHDQCLVFNRAMEFLTVPVPGQPLDSMQYNWDAQKILLGMANRLPERLIIKRSSYRAIRKVLGALRKSEGERGTAIRLSELWPPYRQDFDGTDAKRSAESNRSRSFQAGVLAKAGGYLEQDYDRALDALGGMNDGSPTIPTRSLPPAEWTGRRRHLNIYITWAMNVRATRNAQEAWQIFQKFAQETRMTPNFQVYTEMFVKLWANEIRSEVSPESVPGESIETYPVPELNYSVYEMARLAPPTVSQLYDDMIRHGVKPAGRGLHILVTMAKSVDEALGLIKDSGIVPSEVLGSLALTKAPSHKALQKLPPPLFASYIQLLCNLQPRYHVAGNKFPRRDIHHIRHAVDLVSTRLTANTIESIRLRSPWHIILDALASPSLILDVKKDGYGNDMAALTLFMDLLKSINVSIGVDARIFLELCRVIRKAALSRLKPMQESEQMRDFHLPGTSFLISTLRDAFSMLTTPIPGDDHSPMLRFQHPLGPQHLHAYMRVLAFLDAKDEMLDLMFWILDHHKNVVTEVERFGNRGARMLARTICAFQAFVNPVLDEVAQNALCDGMERAQESSASWRWPTPEEIDQYIANDFGVGGFILRRRALERPQFFGANPLEKESTVRRLAIDITTPDN